MTPAPHTAPTAYRALPRLFGDEFAAHPERAYAALRAAGPVAYAEIDPGVEGLIVTSRRAARDLLIDTATYSKDPHLWRALAEGRVPPDSPVLALMAPYRSLLYVDGAAHTRLRAAMDDSLGAIDRHQLRHDTHAHAAALIGRILTDGEADLMSQFADRLPLMVFTDLLGCPEPLVSRMVDACYRMIASGPGAVQARHDLNACLAETIDAKQRTPGRDVTSRMLAHPARLDHDEIINQLIVVIGAGSVPTAAWTGSALSLLLTHDAHAGDLVNGNITIRRALDKVLWTAAPMANFSAHYARHPTVLAGVPIPDGVPLLISHAATGTDPTAPQLDYANKSHLAWSAGPHRCPADDLAYPIVETAIKTVLDSLWDLRLAHPGQLPYRQGLFHRCPAALHVTYRKRTEPTTTGGALAHPPRAGRQHPCPHH